MRQNNSTIDIYQIVSNSAVYVENNIKAGIGDIFLQDHWTIWSPENLNLSTSRDNYISYKIDTLLRIRIRNVTYTT